MTTFRAQEELDNIREYFEDRQDASMEPGEDRFHGNKEMSLLQDLEKVENSIKALCNGISEAVTKLGNLGPDFDHCPHLDEGFCSRCSAPASYAEHLQGCQHDKAWFALRAVRPGPQLPGFPTLMELVENAIVELSAARAELRAAADHHRAHHDLEDSK